LSQINKYKMPVNLRWPDKRHFYGYLIQDRIEVLLDWVMAHGRLRYSDSNTISFYEVRDGVDTPTADELRLMKIL